LTKTLPGKEVCLVRAPTNHHVKTKSTNFRLEVHLDLCFALELAGIWQLVVEIKAIGKDDVLSL